MNIAKRNFWPAMRFELCTPGLKREKDSEKENEIKVREIDREEKRIVINVQLVFPNDPSVTHSAKFFF